MNRAPIKAKPYKRKCAICREPVITTDLRVKWCSVEHGATYAAQLLDRKKQKARTAERRADAVRREKLKSRADWLREAQAEFNGWIREVRDANEPCISCGRFHQGAYDAGHYRSVGAQPALRFHEDNVHKQCVPCNQFKSGNAIEYRMRLIAKIGAERVEALEQEHAAKKYTIEEIRAIKLDYRARRKAHQAAQTAVA